MAARIRLMLIVSACALLAGPATAATVPPSSKARAATTYALAQVGVPYTWGGVSPHTGFDSAGLVVWSFHEVGVSLPHYTGALFRQGARVPRRSLERGDLVFFDDASHVGIYVGDGRFIHAPGTDRPVALARLSSPHYRSSYSGAVRIG